MTFDQSMSVKTPEGSGAKAPAPAGEPLGKAPWRHHLARWLRVIGFVFAVVCLGLLGQRLVAVSGDLPTQVWSLGYIARLCFAVVLYIAAVSVFAVGWWCLLASRVRLPWRPVLAAAHLAQVGKYLPANVAQYAARVEMLRVHGVGAKFGVRVLLSESVAMVGVALMAISAVREPILHALGKLPGLEMLIGELDRGLFFGLLSALGAVIAFSGLRLSGASVRNLPALLPYAGYLALQGVVLYTLASPLGSGGLTLYDAIVVFAVAWAAGFVVIGAPAGLGIRDVLLVGMLTAWMAEPAALTLVLAHRWVVTVGDGACFGVGLLLRSRDKASMPKIERLERQQPTL